MSNLLEQASLVLIPSGYKEDVVYSEIPLDGSGDMSFTRSSNGTRINSAGLVEDVPWNLVGYSEDFSDAYWNKNNSPTMAYNVATAPNGTMTADSIQSNITSFYQSVGAPSLSIAPNSTVTLSIYIKKETSKTYFGGSYLYFTGGTAKLTYVIFDEVNGIINIVAPDQVSMVTSVESVGDWWRFIVTGTDTGSNTSLSFAFYGTLSQNGTTLDTGIGSARTIWGAQVNIGTTAKPYFPTTDRLNVPRLTYQNGGGGCPSLLLEKQSTNLYPYSEDFTQWTASSATVTANNTTSPDGTQNADRVQFTGAGYLLGTSQGSGNVYTISCYAKRNGSGTQSVGFFKDGSGVVDSAWALTSDWQRFTYTYTASNGSYSGIAGVNGVDVFVWGAQFEQSSYATSLIPSNGSSATRVADACSKTGISSLIGQTEGVLFVDFEFKGYDELSKWIAFLGTGSSYIGLYTDNVFRIVADVANAGTSQFISQTFTFSVGTRYKMAIAYKANDFAFYINGTQIATDSSGTVPTTSQFDFNYNTTANNLTSRIYNQAILFKTRLTNAELASLTTI